MMTKNDSAEAIKAERRFAIVHHEDVDRRLIYGNVSVSYRADTDSLDMHVKFSPNVSWVEHTPTGETMKLMFSTGRRMSEFLQHDEAFLETARRKIAEKEGWL